MSFQKLSFDNLVKQLNKHQFKQLHIHHTWKPAHSSFKGNNHNQMQQSMKNYHVNTNKWSDIAQHLTLFPDGVWLTGRPFGKSPASITGWNTGALCVEMIGNFDLPNSQPFNSLGYDKLGGNQKLQMLQLINYFIDKYGESSIKFHRDSSTAYKTCPGTSLNKQTLIKEARALKNPVKPPVIVNKPIVAPTPPPIIKVDTKIPSGWAKESWDWGILNNLVDGTNPKGNVTREQLTAVLHRYHKMEGAIIVNKPTPITPQVLTPQDIPSGWAKESWDWGISNNLVDGTSPKGNMTREQLAAVLHRYHKMVK